MSENKEPEWLFPFDFMGVGDSFFIPTLNPTNMIYVVDTRAKIAKCKIRVSVVIEDECLGVRVWKLA